MDLKISDLSSSIKKSKDPPDQDAQFDTNGGENDRPQKNIDVKIFSSEIELPEFSPEEATGRRNEQENAGQSIQQNNLLQVPVAEPFIPHGLRKTEKRSSIKAHERPDTDEKDDAPEEEEKEKQKKTWMRMSLLIGKNDENNIENINNQP